MFSRKILALLLVSAAFSAPKAGSKPDGKSWWAHVQVLADDKMEGRDTGTEGHRRAAAYVADQFKKSGLKPAGTNGYFQTVAFNSRTVDEKNSSLILVHNDTKQ